MGTFAWGVTDGSRSSGALTAFFSMTRYSCCFWHYMKTPAGTLSSGDFKLDRTQLMSARPNGYLDLAPGAHDLLLSDSTNASRPGMTPSEGFCWCEALRHGIKCSWSSLLRRYQPAFTYAGVRYCCGKRKVRLRVDLPQHYR